MFKKLKSETVNSFLGRPFFYADYESGTGWESKIDTIERNLMYDSYILELSCGTLVKMDRVELYECRNKPMLTNLKETNV